MMEEIGLVEEISLIEEFGMELQEKEKILQQKILQCEMEIEKLAEEKEQANENLNLNFFSPIHAKQESGKENKAVKKSVCEKALEKLQNELLNAGEKVSRMKKLKKFLEVQDASKKTMLTEERNYEDRKVGIKVLETQEEERQRIARELHDSTVQNLTLFVHKTELCLKLVDIDIIRVKLELKAMINTVHETINDMRSIIYDMRPMSLDDLGLKVTIQRLVNQMKERTENIKFKFYVVNEEVFLPSVVILTLFRIVQEACNNAIKHAQAKKISIRICYEENQISMEINDDGIGFDTNKIRENETSGYSGFGLPMMKERVFLMTGDIAIESEIGMGTHIKVSVPYI